MLLFSVLLSCSAKDEEHVNYRNYMREFVIDIANYARSFNPDFIIVPQNGEELLKDANGSVSDEYLNVISGVGREELFFGYERDDAPTPEDERERLISYLDIAKNQGKKVLVTDYCTTHVYVDSSYILSDLHGYIAFAANERELSRIPPYPQVPHNVNEDDIESINNAKNFLYLINPENFQSKEEYLDTLRNTDYDLLIIDAFFNDTLLRVSDLNSLKRKKNGSLRLVIAYVSIGEAEDYRYYWKEEWASNPPSWLLGENANWQGNYAVKYWDPEWQKIIYGNDSSYIKRVIDAGFDGVYLDKIDEYEYFEK